MFKYFALLLLSACACAGTNNLPVESAGVIRLSHVNKFQQALAGDIVPRDTSGNVGDLTANLGTTSNRWALITGKKLSLVQSVGGNALSLVSPASLASAYTLTLPPALPAETLPLLFTSSGIGSLAYPSLNYVLSASCGNYFNNTSIYPTFGAVSGLSATITTHGNPVVITLVADGTIPAYPIYNGITWGNTGGNSAAPAIEIVRSGTPITLNIFNVAVGATSASAILSPSIIQHFDPVGAGTYTYTVQTAVSGLSGLGVNFEYMKLLVYELL